MVVPATTCMQHPCTESLPPPILCMPRSWVRLARIPRSSEEQLSRAYRLLIAQLTQEHAEIRLSAFQIVDELFARSHQFRMLVVANFQEFLELTLGTDPAQPLPPPREAAQRLRQAATRAVEGWNEKFGEAYKKLALGYHFLRHNKKVDFQDTNARTLAERKREEEKQKHLDKIYQERASQAEREMQGKCPGQREGPTPLGVARGLAVHSPGPRALAARDPGFETG